MKKGERPVAGNKWVVLVIALGLWAVFFYAMDQYLMRAQGLPVGADMMPL